MVHLICALWYLRRSVKRIIPSQYHFMMVLHTQSNSIGLNRKGCQIKKLKSLALMRPKMNLI
ncbi:hypothetical protein ACSBR2_026226 [Camellia fascicularis]